MMVPFWIPIRIRHLTSRVPKKGTIISTPIWVPDAFEDGFGVWSLGFRSSALGLRCWVCAGARGLRIPNFKCVNVGFGCGDWDFKCQHDLHG